MVSQDSHRSVYLIVSSGLGVWISLQSSAVVRLYHATSFENLADIDVAPAVHKMLAGIVFNLRWFESKDTFIVLSISVCVMIVTFKKLTGYGDIWRHFGANIEKYIEIAESCSQ